MNPLPGAHRAQLLLGEIVDGSGAQLERCLNFGHARHPGNGQASVLHEEVDHEDRTEPPLGSS